LFVPQGVVAVITFNGRLVGRKPKIKESVLQGGQELLMAERTRRM
jgi:hypothetical protein